MAFLFVLFTGAVVRILLDIRNQFKSENHMVEKLLNCSDKELSTCAFRTKHWLWMLHCQLLDVLSQNITSLLCPARNFGNNIKFLHDTHKKDSNQSKF